MDWNSHNIADLVRRALEEDIGTGDATTAATIPPRASARAHILARQTLVCAGLPIAEKIFRALGLTDEQARQRFGFFLDALSYGTPPHGGIALGLDRVAMLLAGEKSLREVIAFPKTTAAQDLMAESPSEVDVDQLDQLGIAIKPSAKKAAE